MVEKNPVITYNLIGQALLSRYHPSLDPQGRFQSEAGKEPLALRREWGFAPLCGAAAISMAALKAPVAPEEGTTGSHPVVSRDFYVFCRL